MRAASLNLSQAAALDGLDLQGTQVAGAASFDQAQLQGPLDVAGDAEPPGSQVHLGGDDLKVPADVEGLVGGEVFAVVAPGSFQARRAVVVGAHRDLAGKA